MNWIQSIRGLLEYYTANKHTLERTLVKMCLITDFYYAEKLGLVDTSNLKEIDDFYLKRIKQFVDDEDLAKEFISKYKESVEEEEEKRRSGLR